MRRCILAGLLSLWPMSVTAQSGTDGVVQVMAKTPCKDIIAILGKTDGANEPDPRYQLIFAIITGYAFGTFGPSSYIGQLENVTTRVMVTCVTSPTSNLHEVLSQL